MAKVYLLCGRICSGKTYLARELQKAHNGVILSTDEVTYDLTANEQGPSYDAFAKRVNRYLMKKAAEIARAGANVILDWGFWTKTDRAEIAEYLKGEQIPFEWHYLDISDARWNANIASRNARIESGEGGSDFFVDDGLKAKVMTLFETPSESEIDVWHTIG